MQLPESRFDGVFANASLFHVPSQEMPKVLLKLLTRAYQEHTNPTLRQPDREVIFSCFTPRMLRQSLFCWRHFASSRESINLGH
jgi:hypothetical protein